MQMGLSIFLTIDSINADKLNYEFVIKLLCFVFCTLGVQQMEESSETATTVAIVMTEDKGTVSFHIGFIFIYQEVPLRRMSSYW